MLVKAWYHKNPLRVYALARRMSVLFDTGRTDLNPRRFWCPGTYFKHPARAKAIILVMVPAKGRDSVALGRRAARLLEARKGLVLDWAGADRKSGVWLILKTLAIDAKTGKNRELRLDTDDFAAIRALAPGRRYRGRAGMKKLGERHLSRLMVRGMSR